MAKPVPSLCSGVCECAAGQTSHTVGPRVRMRGPAESPGTTGRCGRSAGLEPALQSLCLVSLLLRPPSPVLGCMTCFVQASEIVECKKTTSLMAVH